MLFIVGDINFSDGFFDTGFGIGSSIKNGNNVFKHIKREKNDIYFGNLECVVSGKSNKLGLYKSQFRIEPSSLKHIEHFNIYNVANNHVMQHGEEAYIEMLASIDHLKSAYVGANHKRILKFNHQEKEIGILSFSQREEKYSSNPLYWYNPEYSDIELEYNKIANLNFKIAYIHWGNEFIDYPYVDQKKFAHWLIDLGFDLIVGVHPHVLQGYEIYKGKYIFYSLGNFLFNMPFDSTRYSVILNIDFSSTSIKVGYNYIHLGKDNLPKIIQEEKTPAKYRFEYLNERLNIETENELYYKSVDLFNKKYRLSNYIYVFKSLYKFRIADITGIFLDFIKRRFI